MERTAPALAAGPAARPHSGPAVQRSGQALPGLLLVRVGNAPEAASSGGRSRGTAIKSDLATCPDIVWNYAGVNTRSRHGGDVQQFRTERTPLRDLGKNCLDFSWQHLVGRFDPDAALRWRHSGVAHQLPRDEREPT